MAAYVRKPNKPGLICLAAYAREHNKPRTLKEQAGEPEPLWLKLTDKVL
jgi:hypothetical protein